MTGITKRHVYAALGIYEAEAYKHGVTGENAVAVDASADDVMEIFAALIARNAELEADAARWQHARKLLTVDDIEGMQGAFVSFGRLVSEVESERADAAIDAARGAP